MEAANDELLQGGTGVAVCEEDCLGPQVKRRYEHLEVQLGCNAKEEWRGEGIAVRVEGPSKSTASCE